MTFARSSLPAAHQFPEPDRQGLLVCAKVPPRRTGRQIRARLMQRQRQPAQLCRQTPRRGAVPGAGARSSKTCAPSAWPSESSRIMRDRPPPLRIADPAGDQHQACAGGPQPAGPGIHRPVARCQRRGIIRVVQHQHPPCGLLQLLPQHIGRIQPPGQRFIYLAADAPSSPARPSKSCVIDSASAAGTHQAQRSSARTRAATARATVDLPEPPSPASTTA